MSILLSLTLLVLAVVTFRTASSFSISSSSRYPRTRISTFRSTPHYSHSTSSLSLSPISTITKQVKAKFETPYWTDISPMTGQSKFLQLATLVRVVIPSLVAGILAYFTFPFLSLSLASLFNDAGIFAVLSQDSSQFVQNFLTVSGLLFSILVGQTFYFMYQQQEMIYLSLFEEVTEAKSLLEQTALLCGGRPMYFKVLKFINNYLQVSEPR